MDWWNRGFDASRGYVNDQISYCLSRISQADEENAKLKLLIVRILEKSLEKGLFSQEDIEDLCKDSDLSSKIFAPKPEDNPEIKLKFHFGENESGD